jgi:leucyl aminopeptidase (aminopeptidase T)
MRISAVDYDLLAAARRVIESALCLVPGDTVVIVSDRERASMSKALVEAASWAKTKAITFELDDFGPPPIGDLPAPIEAALSQAQGSIFVARSLGPEIELRRQLVAAVAKSGARHAHMLGLTAKTMIAGLAVDPHRIAHFARALRMRLRPTSEVRVKSAAGTDLLIRLDPRYSWFESSGVIRPGRWLNLPSGELTTSPEAVDGVFVCNASMSRIPGVEQESMQRTPLRIEIEGQRVTEVTGSHPDVVRAVEAFTRGAANQDRVGIVSFGTNVGLSEPAGALIVDQTLPGVHIALGAPAPELTGLEWRSSGQLVLTASQADVDIDGSAVIRNGRYLIG